MNIFSYNPKTDNSLEEDLDLEQALAEFYYLTAIEGSFFGIVDSEEKCIQFAWLSKDKFLVDIPNPPDFINYQKYAGYEECVEMIKRVYALNEVVQFSGMVKVDINREGLDEMLGNE